MLLIICLILFIINQILLYHNIGNAFTISYVDDLLFFPIALSLVTLVQKFKSINYIVPISVIVGFFVFVSILFEIILPQISNRYTSDSNDVVCYFLGSLFYLVYHNRNPII